MSRRATLWFVALVGLATLGLAALGAAMVRRDADAAQSRVVAALAAHLAETGRLLHEAVEARAVACRALLRAAAGADTETLRALAREDRFATQIFLLDPDGRFLHPPPTAAQRTAQESAFLLRTADLWAAGGAFGSLAEDAEARTGDSGWRVWSWGRGTSLLYWERLADGRVAGVEIARAALLAELLARLPHSAETPGLTVLRDPTGDAVYEWGAHRPAADEAPVCVEELQPPLTAWTLRHYAALSPGAARRTALATVLPGLCAWLLAIGAAAFLFLRENRRALREAELRVSFVNQVSHELKTPLTNIRLYADLARDALPPESERAHAHLDVIGSETERLGRMIQNVLTFGRQRRAALTLRRAPTEPGPLLRGIVERFAPALQARAIVPHVEIAASERVLADADAIEQIVVNLLSNVEKYAVPGSVTLQLTCRDGQTELCVADEGPGIPPAARERVFEPFARLGGDTRDGVSGAGIGLSIVRALARLHGGDAWVEDAAPGARMRVRLRTPQVEEEPVA